MSESQCWIYFWRCRNHWIWIAFAMSESQCWDWFSKSRKPTNLICFQNEWKPMLVLFFIALETDEFEFVFVMSNGP
jgi:hypothetical protein